MKLIRNENTQKLTEIDLRFFVQQIVKGLEYMHSKNVIHLDLKPGIDSPLFILKYSPIHKLLIEYEVHTMNHRLCDFHLW